MPVAGPLGSRLDPGQLPAAPLWGVRSKPNALCRTWVGAALGQAGAKLVPAPLRCRAGRPGTVVSLVSGGERHVVDKLGRRLGVNISEVEVRGGEASEVESRPAAPAAAPATAVGGKEQGAATPRRPRTRRSN